jgi:hypothetical protein
MMRAPVSTAFAIGVGLVILAGYFLPFPLLNSLQATLLGWAIVIAGFAGLVGIINLFLNHLRKATSKTQRDPYSPIFLVSFLATLAAGLWFGPADSLLQQVIQSVQIPVEASLMAALAITLVVTGLRLLQRRRWDGMAVLFAISVVLFLVIASGLLAGVNLPLLRDIAAFIDRLPAAGARGILIGIALGSLTTGLRVLMGADRPYSG